MKKIISFLLLFSCSNNKQSSSYIETIKDLDTLEQNFEILIELYEIERETEYLIYRLKNEKD
jgi:hypothetical protein